MVDKFLIGFIVFFLLFYLINPSYQNPDLPEDKYAEAGFFDFKRNKPEPKKEIKTKELIPGVDRKYTGYEVAMYYLKAHESFRPWEYPDGRYPSKGFGLNLTPDHTKWASGVLGFPARSRNWTYTEGQTVLRAFWQKKFDKYGFDDLTDYQRTALLLHSYNAGKTTNIRGCCGSKIGCGRKGGGKNKKIRDAHNRRRDFEWRLYNNKVSQKEITELRQEAIRVEAKWKKYNKVK
jgi:hypothetical protein